ncbi:hypothetical protein D9M68_799820 [compost metagenome]
MDEGLRCGAAAAALADRDDPGCWAVLQHSWVDQVIDHHDFGLGQCPNRLEGQQLRIAGACAYQPDFCIHHDISS